VKKKIAALTLTGLALTLVASSHHWVHASDHDDGSQATAQNNLNLTDLFAFREDNQTGNGADSGNLILVMNSNGHTPAAQQVFFNTAGNYDFHVSRVTNSDSTPTGSDDVIFQFNFSDPDANQHQPFTLTVIKGGQSTLVSGSAITTTLAEGQGGTVTENRLNAGATPITVFAGLREDPFFFDVEQFFKVRAGAAGLGPKVSFNPPATAVDGFAHQNVNSIVMRVPLPFLQSSAAETVFDVWETTSIK
jgi:hypothetical protein